MRKTLQLILLLMTLAGSKTYGQTLSMEGSTRNTAGTPVAGATVMLISATESRTTATDARGIFRFAALKDTAFRLTVTCIGFEPFTKEYRITRKNPKVLLPPILLTGAISTMQEVVIRALVPVKVKEDTVEFDARAYKVRPGDALEEIIKKLPGVEVDKQGKITTGGEPVTRVRLNGKDFFGDDATAALQNLPADIVRNLQIIDDYGELNNLAGVKSGEPAKILNINTEPDKETGYFVKGAAGLGSYQRYTGRLQANNFTPNRQLSAEGNLNNTGSTDGLRVHRSAKVNYRANWSERFVSYGSYRFNNSDNRSSEQVFRQDIYKDYTRFDEENQQNKSSQNSHRLSWNLETRKDRKSYFKFSPDIAYSTTRSGTTGLNHTRLLSATSLRNYNTLSDSRATGVGTEVLFNHKFSKPGRNLSLQAGIEYSGDQQHRDVGNEYTLTDSLQNTTQTQQRQFWDSRNSSTRTRTELSYREPLSQRSSLELKYQWNRTGNESLRDIRDGKSLVDSAVTSQLTNHYTYQFTTQRIGVQYHYRKTKYNYNIGLTAQPVLLEGQDLSRGVHTSRSTFNLIPSARFSYTFSKKSSFTAFYFGRNNQPGFHQLQPITDNSNLQNIVIGNPDLKPELENRLQLRYKKSGTGRGYTVFTRLDLSQTHNKIVTSRVVIADSLKQQTTYQNADGFSTANADYSVVRPFSNRKYTVTYFGGSNYSRNIAFSNNERNIGNNLSFRQGVKMGVDINEKMDARFNAAYSLTRTTYSLESFSDRQTSRIFLGLEGRNYLFDSWVLGYDFSRTVNNGYQAADVDPTILNVYLEYQFLQRDKGRLRLQGYDLLNENTGITRDIFDNQIVDRQTNRLGRYFLLSFEFRLNQFGEKG